MAFDKHLNLVLVDTEEFRTLRHKRGPEARAAIVEERQEKRSLGLIILRGDNVVSIAVEGPPPPEKRARTTGPGGMGAGGPGGAGRGNTMMGRGNGGNLPPPPGAPFGLGAAPVHGVGGMAGPPPGMGRGMGGPPPGMGRGMAPPGMGGPRY